jgi:hypothetical protein
MSLQTPDAIGTLQRKLYGRHVPRLGMRRRGRRARLHRHSVVRERDGKHQLPASTVFAESNEGVSPCSSEGRVERITAFVEKRKAAWKGR